MHQSCKDAYWIAFGFSRNVARNTTASVGLQVGRCRSFWDRRVRFQSNPNRKPDVDLSATERLVTPIKRVLPQAHPRGTVRSQDPPSSDSAPGFPTQTSPCPKLKVQQRSRLVLPMPGQHVLDRHSGRPFSKLPETLGSVPNMRPKPKV
jgi:hypothetical protein